MQTLTSLVLGDGMSDKPFACFARQKRECIKTNEAINADESDVNCSQVVCCIVSYC